MSRIVGVLVALLAAADARAIGNVQVSVAGDKLTVVGDAAPNAIQIVPGVGSGAFVVVGLAGTLVNGSLTAMVSGVQKMSVETNAGADSVELTDVVLDGTLLVNLGDDADGFVMQGGRVKHKADIKGGKEADDIRIRQGARFGGPLFVRGGKKIDNIIVTDASFGGDSEIRGGGGSDTITVQLSTLDAGGNLIVGGADGEDHVMVLDNAFNDDVQLYMGAGDDDLRIQGNDFEEKLRAEGNDGDDTLDLDGDNSFDARQPPKVSGFQDLD